MNIYKIQRHTNIIFKYSGTLTPHGMGADFPMLFYKSMYPATIKRQQYSVNNYSSSFWAFLNSNGVIPVFFLNKI